jgi:methyl-accepting chemotaxis protein
MRYFKTMTGKFFFFVLIVLLISQTLGTIILFYHTRSALHNTLLERMESIASLVANVIAIPLRNGNMDNIQFHIDEVIRDDDITSIHILDSNENLIRENIKTEDVGQEAVSLFLIRKSDPVRIPISAQGDNIGFVVLDYSARRLNEKMIQSIVLISLYQGIMLLVIGIIVILFFNRNIKKPVDRINRAVEKITSGEISTAIPDLGENEIGSIAKGISFLSERLFGIISQLNNTIVNVSMAIKQVDLLYKNVIKGVSKQSMAMSDLIKSIHSANSSLGKISNSTGELSKFSTENVSSLLETKASAEEIAEHSLKLYSLTGEFYDSVVQLNKSAESKSTDAQEALSAVEETSASVEEIGASIKEVEEHAADSARLAENVRTITSDTGMLAVVNAVEGMEKITAEVNTSSEIIRQLGMRSKDIEKVLSVIKEVTERTNLLSLNAAILASQAGEYGKSFSVVAEEISALSDRTATSTRDISEIVKSIQKDIRSAVSSIDNAKGKVETGNTLVLKVGDTLKNALSEADKSTEMTQAIKRATEEQSIGLRQITTAIDGIRNMIRNITLSTAEEVKSLGYLLNNVTNVKKIADVSKGATEEQAAGIRTISRNLELANDRIVHINGATLDHKTLNDEVIKAMSTIDGLGKGIINDMEDVSSSLNSLSEEIEILKNELGVFKIT